MTILLRGSLGIALALLALGLFASPARAATTVSGNILDGTVWTAENGPYVVSGARVPVGATLTIEPGVVVKMALGRGLPVDGTLIAHGTEGEPIYFTSIKDDTVGGDTNGDGTLTSPAALDWQQIQIFQTAHAEISHAVIRYGGLRSPTTGLSNCGIGVRHCQGGLTNLGTVHVSDSTFSHNYNGGLYQVLGTSTIEGTTFKNSTGNHIVSTGGALLIDNSVFDTATAYALSVDEGTRFLSLLNSTFTGSTREDAYVHASVEFLHGGNTGTGSGKGFYISGEFVRDTVWTKDGIPYVTAVTVPQDVSLTIEPGVIIKMVFGAGMPMYGTLIAHGTEAEPIYFTSIRDDSIGGDTNGDGGATTPAARDWTQIRVFNTGSATISHAVLRYGGESYRPGLNHCGVGIITCSGVISNVGSIHIADTEMTQNYSYAVYQLGGTSTVERGYIKPATSLGATMYVAGGEMSVRESTFRGGRWGLQSGQGTLKLELLGNTFVENLLTDVLVEASTDFIHASNTSSSIAGRGFQVTGTVVGEKVWTPDNIPYIVGTTNVPQGATLTILPGTVMKFLPSGLAVHGSLIAHGTEENPIHFTSINDDTVAGDTNGNGSTTIPARGDWEQIRVFTTGNAAISNAVLRYGGDPYRPGLNNCGDGIRICYGVISNVGALTLADSYLSDNVSYTLYQTGGSSSVDRISLHGNINAATVRVEGGAMRINYSSIYPTGYYGTGISGISAGDSLEVVDAQNNWWGDPTGPYNPTLNPSGLGAGASENVLFTPWLSADPFAEEPEPELDPLILQYEPILHFHEDEDFYPMNVEAFVESSALWSTDGIGDTQLQPEGSVTTATISGPDTEDWYLAFSTPDQAKSFDPAAAKQKYDELVSSGEAVPTYYVHKMEQDGWIVLQYWYFYAFNSWLEHGGRNNHEGDWESVFVFLDKNTKEPKHAAFSAHLNDGDAEAVNPSQYDSVRRDWNEEEIDLIGQNVKSFVAAGSHANYPKAADHMVGRFVDQTSADGISLSGSAWQGRNQILASVPLWMLYKGKWGSDGPLLPGSDGPSGPAFIDVNLFSSLKRFEEPVKWAGLDKIATHSGDGSASELTFENQTTKMSFTEPVLLGETVTSDQHDELITFGNLDAVNLLPRFWDFSTSLPSGSFEVDVELGYTDEEVEALGLSEEKLSVFLYNEESSVWNPVTSLIDALANTISFTTTHFSRYAIGQLVVTNEPPVLDPIGDQTVGEGDTLEFTISATDPDEGDTLTYAAANLPEGASFDPATRTFYWNTDYDDAGNYTDIEFTVTDDGEPLGLDVELITITVGDVNRAPVFENPGPQEILEDERLDMVISASDPDGDAVELTAVNLPERASFSTSTGEFSWKPTRSQEGVYVLTFVAADDGEPKASSTLDVVITVGDNPTPVELAEQLIALVLSYQLPQEIENAYLANLKKVPTFIVEGKITPAAQQLEAFRQKVEMDYRKGKIDLEMKNTLLEHAGDLLIGLDID